LEIKDSGFTGNHAAFEKVFKMYFKELHAYAFLFLKNPAAASETVQQVFYKIWEKKESITVQVSVKAYLYKSVYNECMLLLKKQKRMDAFKIYTLYRDKNTVAAGAAEKIENNELELKLHAALDQLPEQCRIIFQLNRFEGMKYREIATVLNLSLRTVENQMGKALKRLRTSLAEYLPLLIFLLWNF
jgi:RNA polymerase sigma-70 factor (ECF subfamily)